MANLEDGILAFENGDYVAAFKEFWVLAEQGSVNAQFNIGTMYLHGQGVAHDYKEASKWFLKAAEQGDANAQSNLGLTRKRIDHDRRANDLRRFPPIVQRVKELMEELPVETC